MGIKISLDTNKLDRIVAKARSYISKSKVDELKARIAKELRDEVAANYNGAEGEYILYEGYVVPNVAVDIREDGELTVVFTEASMAAWVIEFGAGVYFNPSGTPNPLRPEGLVPIGQWGKGYGSRKIWGYYEDPADKSTLKLTHGTPASMPIFHAVQSIIPRIPQIAKEVFKGG